MKKIMLAIFLSSISFSFCAKIDLTQKAEKYKEVLKFLYVNRGNFKAVCPAELFPKNMQTATGLINGCKEVSEMLNEGLNNSSAKKPVVTVQLPDGTTYTHGNIKYYKKLNPYFIEQVKTNTPSGETN